MSGVKHSKPFLELEESGNQYIFLIVWTLVFVKTATSFSAFTAKSMKVGVRNHVALTNKRLFCCVLKIVTDQIPKLKTFLRTIETISKTKHVMGLDHGCS